MGGRLAKRKKILLVEDEIDIHQALLQVIREYVTAFPVEIYSAYNGRQALNKLNGMKFDLVLLDLMMPEMNGEELLREISLSANKCSPPVPVIIVSAMSKERVSGFIKDTPFIEKPLDIDIFVTAIEDTLRGRKKRNAEVEISH